MSYFGKHNLFGQLSLFKFVKIFFFFNTVLLFFVFFLGVVISDGSPSVVHGYFLDLNLFIKQIFIPAEMSEIRSLNDSALNKLNNLSADLGSIKNQRDVLKSEVITLNKLLISDAYNVKPSKVQLLEQALTEEKLLKESKGKPPGFKQLCLTGLVAFIILKSIILLNIGWD